MVNKDFLKQVLCEEKKLLALTEVKHICVPKYDELSVSNLFPTLKERADFMKYLPDQLAKGRQPDRTYFFNVLNTIDEAYVANLIAFANEQRFGTDAKPEIEHLVKVSDDWWSKLNSVPVFSCKYF